MKKPVFLLVFIALFLGSPFAQDTVRYGDPWYAFNPLPAIPTGGRNIVSPCSPLIQGNCQPNRIYLGYPNNSYTIYGVAVVMDSIPGPEWNYIVTMLRGMDYHFDSIENPYYTKIIVDSLYQEDTIKTWTDPIIKRCRFEYFYNYDAGSNDYKDSVTKNCIEFYFDNPVKMNNTEEGSFSDTIWVGVHTCNNNPPSLLSEIAPITPCPLNFPDSITTPLLWYYPSPPGPGYSFYYLPSINMGSASSPRVWGGIFPIVERRCSVPRGLTLASDSLSASWRSDTDAELFQLAVCTNTVEPDDGLLFTTSATSQVLPPFHRDSTYRLYLRKMCNFRQDSVWSDWSMPLVIAPRPSESIEEIRNSKFEIQISPNPATKQVQVTSNFNLTQINVYDEQGRLIKEFNIQHPSSIINLDISALPAGTYLLRITTPAGTTTKKLLIQ